MNPRALILLIALMSSPGAAVQASPYSDYPKIPEKMMGIALQASDDYKNRRFDAAAAKYQVIIKAYPDCLYAWDNLGVVYFACGQFDKALAAFKKSVSLNPKDAYALANIGIIKYQNNDLTEAAASLEASLAVDPNNAWAHKYLGSVYQKLNRMEEASVEFQKAALLESKRPVADPASRT